MKTLKIISLLLIVLSTTACQKKDDNDGKKIITDVYIAGYELSNNTSVATLWKNGEAQNLTDGSNTAAANGIFVAQTQK